jgi:hypothetical protein
MDPILLYFIMDLLYSTLAVNDDYHLVIIMFAVFDLVVVKIVEPVFNLYLIIIQPLYLFI